MKYKLVISYDGAKFHGFQRQKNVNNVQGYLESVLSNILNEEIVIKGAGRTDKGVHAKYQVIHFETKKNISKLKKKLNNNLEDVRIRKIKKVNDDFHARFSVKNKVYVYKIDLKGNRNHNYYLKEIRPLDIKKMKVASKYMLGMHNFKNFVAGERLSYESTILSIRIYKFNNVLYFRFKGIGFFRYMVRNLVGALLEVGKGKVSPLIIKDMIEKVELEKRLPTVLPNGLYLVKINY